MAVKMFLVEGNNVFTLLDLIRKAAECKGLKYEEGSEKAHSETIAVYTLDTRLLNILAEHGIKHESRPDHVFTLVDKNPQERGSDSIRHWNFKLPKGGKREYDLRVSLSVGFGLSIEKRGFLLWPKAYGTFLSPSGDLPHFRMFKALVGSDKDAPAVARELAASDGSITVTWTDLGLGGIRRISDLFEEFAGRKEAVMQIARRHEVFDPVPYRQNCFNPGEELFITEPAQPDVIQTWREQLNKYRARLVV